jgi:hypothetical protein
MSSFFNKTCKVWGTKRSRTSSYHAQRLAHVERLHRILNIALSNYVKSSHTDWDVKLPYFPLAYRATSHTTRDIVLSSSCTAKRWSHLPTKT